jgi:PAS domain S-box-containing protein
MTSVGTRVTEVIAVFSTAIFRLAQTIYGQLSRLVLAGCLLLLPVMAAPGQTNATRPLRVVMDNNYPPYVFLDDDGKLQGILIDQWRLWEKKSGMAVEISALDWGEALRRMQAGEFDVIDTAFETESRKAWLDFTKPYAKINVPIFFRRDIPGIVDLKSLKGFPVATKAGDAAADLLNQNGISPVRLFNNYESIIAAAKQRKVNVFVMDEPPALFFLNKQGIVSDFRQSAPVNVGEFHRAVKKGNAALLATVVNGFAKLTPEELVAIDKKWRGQELLNLADWKYLGYAALATLLLILLLAVGNWSLKQQVKRRTADLKQSEERFRSFMTHSPAAGWIVDRAGRFHYASPSYYTMFGARHGDLTGQRIGEIYEPELAQKYLANNLQVITAQRAVEAIEPGVRADGSPGVFLVVKFPMTSATGEILLGGTALDITERQHAELRVKYLNRVYAVLSDINQTIVRSPEPPKIFAEACRIAVEKGGFRIAWICLLDPATAQPRIAAHAGMNGGTHEILNQLLQDKTSGGCHFTRHALDTGEHGICNDIATDPQAAAWRALALERNCHAVASLPLKTGGKVVGAFNLYASEAGFFDEEELRLLDELATDISFALTIHGRELERQQLEERLRQSQKMEAVGQLAGGVAHDFNNILTVIQGYCSLLLKGGKLPADTQPLVSEIDSVAERAANLTRQLLAFSRRQVMLPRDLDLNGVVANTTKMLRRLLTEDIAFQVNYSPAPVFVHADAGMLEQILLNLVVNARDAMPKGGQLIIETSRTDFAETAAAPARAGTFAHLCVSDTGGGIAKETLPHIFEPFFTTKAVGKGTGLGLATVYGIVEQHHGWIEVTSEINQGTTFHIYLPRVAETAAVQPELRQPDASPHGTETILLVEDDHSLRTLARNSLTRLGYQIIEAADGGAALELWRTQHATIDLLLTDLMMPGGISGMALAQKLRQSNAGLRVLYMTGYSPEIVNQEKGVQLQEGVNFLPKPFAVEKLARSVRSCLDAAPANPTTS